jgi:hypothetical protein
MADRDVSEKDRGLAAWWTPPQTVSPPEPELPTTPARGIVAFFSENRKDGRWSVPKHLRVLSVFANVKVDLREAVLQSSETVIEAIAVFAEIQVIVPLDFIVECDGEAFMGSFTLSEPKRRGNNVPRRSGGPRVRVIGSAYAGTVSIKVRPPR